MVLWDWFDRLLESYSHQLFRRYLAVREMTSYRTYSLGIN